MSLSVLGLGAFVVAVAAHESTRALLQSITQSRTTFIEDLHALPAEDLGRLANALASLKSAVDHEAAVRAGWLPTICIIILFQIIIATIVFFNLTAYNRRARKSLPENHAPAEAQTEPEDQSQRSRRKKKRRQLLDPTRVLTDVQSSGINPFINGTIVMPFGERLKISILSVTLFPIRLVLLITSILGTALFCKLSVIGVPMKVLEEKPLPGWRCVIRWPSTIFTRLAVFALGYHYITVRGKCGPVSVAPILVPNHNSFVEPMVIQCLVRCSGVGKAELKKVPVISSILCSVQMLFVDRESGGSRSTIMDRIRARTHESGWPALLLFPEGTRTNGEALITFKLGAFAAQRPVQPICVEYPYRHCDPACVKHGPQTLFLMFKLMCQFTNHITVTFLPVYKPTDEELANPRLYGENVRQSMANVLNVPTTNHSLDDVLLQMHARRVGEPVDSAARMELLNVRSRLNVTLETVKDHMQTFARLDTRHQGRITLQEFARGFQTEISPEVRRLFEALDVDRDGTLDFKEYLIGLAVMNDNGADINATLALAFKIFDSEDKGHLTRNQLASILRKVYPSMTDAKVDAYFASADRRGVKQINRDDFIAFARQHEDKIQLFRTALF